MIIVKIFLTVSTLHYLDIQNSYPKIKMNSVVVITKNYHLQKYSKKLKIQISKTGDDRSS